MVEPKYAFEAICPSCGNDVMCAFVKSDVRRDLDQNARKLDLVCDRCGQSIPLTQPQIERARADLA